VREQKKAANEKDFPTWMSQKTKSGEKFFHYWIAQSLGGINFN